MNVLKKLQVNSSDEERSVLGVTDVSKVRSSTTVRSAVRNFGRSNPTFYVDNAELSNSCIIV